MLSVQIKLALISSYHARMSPLLRLSMYYVLAMISLVFQLLSILAVIVILRKVFLNAFFGNFVPGSRIQKLISLIEQSFCCEYPADLLSLYPLGRFYLQGPSPFEAVAN